GGKGDPVDGRGTWQSHGSSGRIPWPRTVGGICPPARGRAWRTECRAEAVTPRKGAWLRRSGACALVRTDIRAISRDNTMLVMKGGRRVMSSDNPRRRHGSSQVLLFLRIEWRRDGRVSGRRSAVH